MEIPYSRWYPILSTRRSQRQYAADKIISPEILASLKKVCEEFHPYPDARTIFVTENAENIFNFIAGSYGAIKDPRGALVFIGKLNNRFISEEVGYTGQGIVLEATALGLSTCWVAGTFRPALTRKILNIKSDEKVFAVSPIGYPREKDTLIEKLFSGFGSHAKRKPLSTLVTGLPRDKWPEWLKPTLEASISAPSSTNRQPWKFEVQEKFIIISTDADKSKIGTSKRLDCGIAMMNFEVAALNAGIKGKWELLEAPQVARFRL